MASPTFRGTALTTHGAQVLLGAPRDRTFEGQLIGVTGSFVQANPIGPRQIIVTGQYRHASGDVALKAAVRHIQAKIGMVGTFVDAGGTSYSSCKLSNYIAGASQTGPNGSMSQVHAVITELVPS